MFKKTIEAKDEIKEGDANLKRISLSTLSTLKENQLNSALKRNIRKNAPKSDKSGAV
jgi:flagella basal body P-ring formation protein FlgA